MITFLLASSGDKAGSRQELCVGEWINEGQENDPCPAHLADINFTALPLKMFLMLHIVGAGNPENGICVV